MKLGLHSLPFICAALVQFTMIKELAYIKKKKKTQKDLIETKQKH